MSSCRRSGFWNEHIWPQVSFLLHPRSARKLPLTFIGTTEALDATIGLVRARLEEPHLSVAQWMRREQQQQGGGGGEGRSHAGAEAGAEADHASGSSSSAATSPSLRVTRPGEFARIEPPRAQGRGVCELYRVDYLALRLPVPAECDGMFGPA